jgi:hypothetical protein
MDRHGASEFRRWDRSLFIDPHYKRRQQQTEGGGREEPAPVPGHGHGEIRKVSCWPRDLCTGPNVAKQ